MKQRNILLLYILTLYIFLNKNKLFAQSKIVGESEWYRPDYAKADVDTVKIRFGSPIENLPYSHETILVYNKQGYLTYYESGYFAHPNQQFSSKPDLNYPIMKFGNSNVFSYDDKNRLIKIALHKNKESGGGITIRDLNKNGGFLPDYYEKAFLENTNKRFGIEIFSIDFAYNKEGKPKKQLIRYLIKTFDGYFAGENFYPEDREIIGTGKTSPLDTLILPNHDLELYRKLGYLGINYFGNPQTNNYNYYKNRLNERKYLNCNTRNLNDKWLWYQNLESYMCPDTASIYPDLTNSLFKGNPIMSFYDLNGKLILTKTKQLKLPNPYSSDGKYRFNCAEVDKVAHLRYFQYDGKDQLKNITSFSIYKISPGSKDPIPFCPDSIQTFYSLPDQYFMVENGNTKYSYDTNGLIVQEEYDDYSYYQSERYAYSACEQTCFPIKKQYIKSQFINYSYTFHPKR